jgi:hypothetical protein
MGACGLRLRALLRRGAHPPTAVPDPMGSEPAALMLPTKERVLTTTTEGGDKTGTEFPNDCYRREVLVGAAERS